LHVNTKLDKEFFNEEQVLLKTKEL
jgi:hypothetical protein